MAGTFQGKSMRLGGGGRFAKGVSELEGQGMSADRSKAIMAARGRAKYGKKRFQAMATNALQKKLRG